MYPASIPETIPGELSGCEERKQTRDNQKGASPIQKADAALKEGISHAMWKDNVLRALEYYDFDIRVKNSVVYLNGHIVSTTSRSRIEKAIRSIDGVRGIKNSLVLDDKLTHEVASSLGKLEHMYGCKFFTGCSHGVVSLNGVVSNENVKMLAEKLAAGNPKVRAVINNVRVSNMKPETQAQPFLQPTIGETIHFLDGVCGAVRQVIINPNNRRVIAMTLQGKFANARPEFNSRAGRILPPTEEMIAVPMDAVRYLTRFSGFLSINSSERDRFVDFDPAHFLVPEKDWTPPYPYCPDEVLFPLERQDMEQHRSSPSVYYASSEVALEESVLREQLIVNDSPGG